MLLAEPVWLLVLLVVPLQLLWEWRRKRLAWPSLASFAKSPRGLAGWWAVVPSFIRVCAWVCLAIALARPQSVGGQTHVAGKGVALVVVLDRSGSMETADFPAAGQEEPIRRLEAARRTFIDFARGRPDDLVGLVVFANEPDLACAPTLDQRALIEAARAIRPARAGEDGTNIGDALAWGLSAVRATSPRRKVLILLTDGQDRPAISEARPLAPEEAAKLVAAFDVTLHTIALGQPSKDGQEAAEGPDIVRLRGLAELGGGRFFEAGDADALVGVFNALNALERSPIQGSVYVRHREEFAPWLAAAAGLLALERLLGWTRWRRIP